MALLKVVRPLKLNGEILQPGEMFRTQNEQGLIDRGYARHLTREETRAILDRYARYAEKVFSEKSRPRTSTIKQAQGLLFATDN